jgi:glucosamine-6-phosphate deaminase
MIVSVHRSARAAAAAAAAVVAATLHRAPRGVLGLPTGRTSVPLYAALVDLHRRGHLDLRRATAFDLDELRGLARDDPRSFHTFLRRHFFGRVNLPPARIHTLRGDAPDWRLEAARYDRALDRAGGLDLCILGIGRNGHIAFNEPARRLRRATHLARLAPGTRRAAAAAFGGRVRAVPTEALTVGLDAILGARRVLLVAVGTSKADIVRKALRGPITSSVPASLLQRHSDLVVVLDRGAAARLGWADYS